MAERKFTRLKASISENAAKTRENVSRELRQSLISDSISNDIDFESVSFDFDKYSGSSKEEVFQFPSNDIKIESVERPNNWRKQLANELIAPSTLFARECIRHYESNKSAIQFVSDKHCGSLYETCLQSSAKFELKAHAFESDDEIIDDDVDFLPQDCDPDFDCRQELARVLSDKQIDLKQFEINLFSPFNNDLQSRKGGHITLRQRTNATNFDEVKTKSLVLSVLKLEFALKQSNGKPIESYFCSVCLFDTKIGRKVSEDFHFQFNNGVNVTSDESRDAKRGFDERWLSRGHNNAIFSVDVSGNSSVYLVLRIEKFLSKNSTDFYVNVTNKNASKAHKSALTSNLSSFYQPFVWSAKRLDLKNTSSAIDLVFDVFYKQEISKLSDDAVITMINNNFIGCTAISGKLETRITEFDANSTRQSVLSSSYFPVFETINTEIRPHIYVESLELSAKPNTQFVHLLYIYPQLLKYDSQKVFSTARNISVTIELRDNDRSDAKALPIIFNPHYCPIFISQLSTALTRHNVTPEFYQEIKVALPLNVNLAKFHILFTFYHISCKDFSKSLIGYSWLALEKQIHCETGIYLSIFGSLPNGYLSCQSLGLGKGFSFSEPELRFVGKDLFRVSLKLVSTVMSRDPELQGTMIGVTRITCSSRDDSRELSKLIAIERALQTKQLKALITCDRIELIRFSQIILQHLMKLFVYSINSEVWEQTLHSVLNLVSIIDNQSVLNEFIEETFTYCAFGDDLFHEQLLITINKLDLKIEQNYRLILRNIWFLFRVLIKSLVQSSIDSFSQNFNIQLKEFMSSLASLIITQSRDNLQESRDANKAISHFFSRLLSIHHKKGFVFRLILYHLSACSQSRDTVLTELRLQSIAILTAHEHYVPLNACENYSTKLSKLFMEKHFFSYILFNEFKTCINSQSVRHVRQQSIIILRNLLAKHSFDSRYQLRDNQLLVTSLYLPIIEIVIENINRLMVDSSQVTEDSNDDVNNKSKTINQNFWSVLSQTNQMFSLDLTREKSFPVRHNRMNSLPIRLDFLNSDEIRDILIIYMHIVKYHATTIFRNLNDKQINDFYRLLEISLNCFEYRTKKCAEIRAKTLPTNVNIENDLIDYLSKQNLSIQTSLIALQCIRALSSEKYAKQNFNLFLTLLSKPQSEQMFLLIFSYLRHFFRKFSHLFFSCDSNIYLAKIVDKIISFCNSRSIAVRNDACATLYALFCANFVLKQDVRKTYFQTIVCVSRFVSKYSNLSRFESAINRMERLSLDRVLSHEVSREFKKTVDRTREIVFATREIRTHSRDLFLACELRLNLANSLTSRELRRTWLEGVVSLHVKNGDCIEAAMTLCHVIVILLKQLRSISTGNVGHIEESLAIMAKISTNIKKEIETNDDDGDENSCEDDNNHVTLQSLENVINDSVELLENAEMFEYATNILKVLLPFYDSELMHDRLSKVYDKLSKIHSKCDTINKSGKRLFATYFRVAFSGKVIQEWVVREPKIVSLAEFHEKMQKLYSNAKFASNDNELIANNGTSLVVVVTHVTPYVENARNDFERHSNVNYFMYESAISQSNDVKNVSKRRVMLTCEHSFPFCAKRIRVIKREENILSPIDVACHEMSERVQRLQQVIKTRDVKLIQLILQGSVNVTVNAGPLVYATAFLSPTDSSDAGVEESRKALKKLFEKFIVLCEHALKLNNELIADNQIEYHNNLKLNFDKLKNELNILLNVNNYNNINSDDIDSSLNSSSRIFDVISGHSFA